MINSLNDIRKNQYNYRQLNFYLNLIIVSCFFVTTVSIIIGLNPRYFNRPSYRKSWIITGLITNLIGGAIAYSKLPETENNLKEIEKDINQYEKINRQLILSSGNQYLDDSLTNQLTPKEADPLTALLEEIKNAPLKNALPSESLTLSDAPVIPEVVSYQEAPPPMEFRLPVKAPPVDGELILDQAAATSLSTVFSSPPGTGKTVTLLSWLQRLLTKFPDTLVTVIAQKNDSFLGLKSIGAVTVFDGLTPSIISDSIDEIFEILSFRKNQDEQERLVFKTQPVWLILDDWFSIYEAIKGDSSWKSIASKISTIITVGREFNVAIAVTTHSFNLASLGLAKDSNIRSCLNIMSLGFISTDEYGRNQGGFDAINGILNNNSIIPSEYRENLKHDLEKLIVDSNKSKTPIIFTTMGHPPRMALLPNLCNVKSWVIPDNILLSIKEKLIRMENVNFLNFHEQENQETVTVSEFSVIGEDIYDAVENEEKRAKIYKLMENGITEKTKIIAEVWGATSGRNYQKALQEYNQLMEI